jgi:hypothetical protein
MMKSIISILLSFVLYSCAGNFFCANNTGIYNVKDYGAKGNGLADDYNAISKTIADIPATGGVLYFPSGKYKTNNGFILNHPTLVLGCGMGNFDSVAITQIDCTSQDATLFTVTADYSKFQNISLKNIYEGIPVSSSTGIKTIGSYVEQKVDYESVSISGFYINFDIQVGAQWVANNIFSINPVKYGMKIQNTVNNDAGDWSITNANFNAINYDADAAIRIESSGGGKISNLKVNCGYPQNRCFNYGIDLTSSALTMILYVTNSSIENFRSDGIHINVLGESWNNFCFNGIGIGVPLGASGCGISLASYRLGAVENIVINGCIFYGKIDNAAITLQNINRATIGNCVNSSFKNLVSQTNCTNISIN